MKKIISLLVCSVLLGTYPIKSQDKDIKTYYAKKYVAVFTDLKTGKFIEEVVMGKDVLINYDQIFKSISLYFTQEDGTPGRVLLTYVTKSKDPITNQPHESEVIMLDQFKVKYFVSIDPFKTKAFYQFPEKDVIEDMRYHLKITDISLSKNW